MTELKPQPNATTIGYEWWLDRLDAIELSVSSQVGQAMHFMSLARTRDATIHLSMIPLALQTQLDQLTRELFGGPPAASHLTAVHTPPRTDSGGAAAQAPAQEGATA